MYNLYSIIEQEIQSFMRDYIQIAHTNEEDVVGLKDGVLTSNPEGSYSFNQYDMLNTIDLYYNSKFKNGLYDSEGQRKVFLNICQFRADVASKMVDLDTKDFIFRPANSSSEWKAWFMQQEFRLWAKEQDFAKLINDVVADYPKYGTVVTKRLKKDVEITPLTSLRNTQDARSLWDAVLTGGFVTEDHNYTINELKEFKKWDTKGLAFKGKAKVYERYGYVPESEMYKGGSEDKEVKALIICTFKNSYIDKATGKKVDASGNILFKSEIEESDFPYSEVHWKKQNGRWLGMGEIENQIENQISRNELVNLRRRMLKWSSLHLFQSPDDLIAKNLIKDVSDGDIIKISPNGNLTQVNAQSQGVAEVASDEEVWEKNSDQKSFTFEVATGESLPSQTPFRLGVLLSSAVKSHFDMKREVLGIYFKRMFFKDLIPIFKSEQRDHVARIEKTVEGYEDLKNVLVEHYANQHYKEIILDPSFITDPSIQIPNIEQIKMQVAQDLTKKKGFFFDIMRDFYDDAEVDLDLTITGEESNIGATIETFTNLLTSIGQNPAILTDPVTRKILKKIMALRGENLDEIVGPMPMQQPQLMQQNPQQPNMQPALPQPANQEQII